MGPLALRRALKRTTVTNFSYYTLVDSREDECVQQITLAVHTTVVQRKEMWNIYALSDQNDYYRKEAPLVGGGVSIDGGGGRIIVHWNRRSGTKKDSCQSCQCGSHS